MESPFALRRAACATSKMRRARRMAHASALLALHSALLALHVVGAVHAQTTSSPATSDGEVATRQPAVAERETLYLFQRVALEPSGHLATLSIDFTPATWRVGSSDGPVATKAQLKAVFGNLQTVIVAGRCIQAAVGAAPRPCAAALGNPDFAGIVNPDLQGEVFGWVATAPSTKLGGGDTPSTAMRYFGLLSPMRYAGRASPGAVVALRYRAAASMQLPMGLDPGTASLIIHNDRLPALTVQTPADYEALARRVAGR